MKSDQPSTPPDPTDDKTPITDQKLLRKLEFVVSDDNFEIATSLQTELYKFAKDAEEKRVSRQAISYWFTKNSVPTRENAYAFLNDFLTSGVDYDKLPASKKMVYKQLQSFLRARLRQYAIDPVSRKDRNEKVYYVSGGNTAIRVSRQVSEFSLIAKSLEGTYLVYRNRLSENERQPIVQEVMKITRRPPELRFEHWYLRNGRYRDSFEGAVVLIGDLLWFLGASRMTPDRFRVMNFRKIRGHPEDSRTILWGILLSDGTSVAADEPGACRVLLRGLLDFPTPTTNAFIDENLRFFKSDDNRLPNCSLIWRLVNNRYPAASEHNSTAPVSEKDGALVIDSILRVDQVTLGKATVELQDDLLSVKP